MIACNAGMKQDSNLDVSIGIVQKRFDIVKDS